MKTEGINGRGEWIRTTDLLVPNLNQAFFLKSLKLRHFQALQNQAVVLFLVEVDCNVWNFGALAVSKSSTLRFRDLVFARGAPEGVPRDRILDESSGHTGINDRLRVDAAP
jgi:hypothetical protein